MSAKTAVTDKSVIAVAIAIIFIVDFLSILITPLSDLEKW
ncbi:hypothetical protein SBF1_6950003 [Candidatus Desulfosporosinus infrequens]|uniref:Uncharacterized protein n=1 Tax=Candidatus Desulfosporosinus infrequens TaxID=2043169 RepID=A0A2U3LP37_9FIRM|nr:hypothetical protein SBF1_6950003 [Candidatus Desulfosporosinus infrequens]